jgi:uncharacterized hydrophobic protein (TIGR00271 family)
MIHVRVVSPVDLSPRLGEVLVGNPAVLNMTTFEGVVHQPPGDVIEFDVLHGKADEVLRSLRGLDLDTRGSIALDNPDVVISASAKIAEEGQPRFEQFAPVWEEVESRIRSDGTYPPSWFMLLVIAGLIGSVGILTNSQILIVAAMVVGPEYGAIMSLAFGVTTRDGSRVVSSTAALFFGFGLAVIASLLLGVMIRAGGLAPKAFLFGIRPVSNLINTPNWFSFIVAVLAGVVGVVSLTEARSSTLIGVFISVTTIPAAADIGVSLAFQSWHEAWGSALQLLLNVTVLSLVAVIGLPLQRGLWRRVLRPHPDPSATSAS